MAAYAIIVASGRGTRMGRPEPKQYIKFNGAPLVVHTIRVFQRTGLFDKIVVVLPPEDVVSRGAEINTYEGVGELMFLPGGSKRRDSVFSAMRTLEPLAQDNDIVCVHDAARPNIDDVQIKACIEAAEKYGAAVLGSPVNDTVKRCDYEGRILETVPRDGLWLAHTPQTAFFGILWRAYNAAAARGLVTTDDAMLLERLNIPVYMVKGSAGNIKITAPEDLELVKKLLS